MWQQFNQDPTRAHKRRAQDNCLPTIATLLGLLCAAVILLSHFWRYI